MIAGTIPTLVNIEYLPPMSLLCSNNKQLLSFAILNKGDSLYSVMIKVLEKKSSTLFASIAFW